MIRLIYKNRRTGQAGKLLKMAFSDRQQTIVCEIGTTQIQSSAKLELNMCKMDIKMDQDERVLGVKAETKGDACLYNVQLIIGHLK